SSFDFLLEDQLLEREEDPTWLRWTARKLSLGALGSNMRFSDMALNKSALNESHIRKGDIESLGPPSENVPGVLPKAR
ncbi:hypothetical protein Tco_0833153, partial [Tanacetum coccineum]